MSPQHEQTRVFGVLWSHCIVLRPPSGPNCFLPNRRVDAKVGA